MLEQEQIDTIIQQSPLDITIDSPSMNIKELKLKTFTKYKIPVEIQRWLINDKILNDDNILLNCISKYEKNLGINFYVCRPTNGNDQLFVEVKFNLTNTVNENTSVELNDKDITFNSINCAENLLDEAAALPLPDEINLEIPVKKCINEDEVVDKEEENSKWKCTLCTFINSSTALACSSCLQAQAIIFLPDQEQESKSENNLIEILNEAAALPLPDEEIIKFPEKILQEIINKKEEKTATWECWFCTLINEPIALACLVCLQERFSNEEINTSDLLSLAAALPVENENGISTWECSFCTLKNPPMALACSACTHEKPLSLQEKTSISEEMKNFLNQGIEIYNETEVSNIVEQITKPTDYINNLPITKETTNSSLCNYIEILSLDDNDIVNNTYAFECPICCLDVEINEGCVLRDCLHTFCRDCLVSTIQYSDDAEVKCPYANDTYSCDSLLQDREIRSLVPLQIYEKYLSKSIRYVEHRTKNSFHCKTPNCPGWCIYDDGVHEFKCPACEFINCLICKLIHNGLTCFEYQEEINKNGKEKLEGERTKDMINQMVHSGKVMNCPTCQVILEKISGCDLILCSMCKTEVCWATRKPRRGPNGCKCGENGNKCHPSCANCH